MADKLMEIQVFAINIAERMFVETADQDYILARIAHLHRLDLNFYWLSLHALEKYFKAILLLNGRSAKGYGHDLPKLHKAVKALSPEIVIDHFDDPHISDLTWLNFSVDRFIARLAQYGAANNRYMTYGYDVTLDDLMKVDQLVWSVRRHCRLLNVTFDDNGHSVSFDWTAQLKGNPDLWRLSGGFPIERVVDGRRGDVIRQLFCYLNTPFAPEAKETPVPWRSAHWNPPLVDYFDCLGSKDTSAENKALAAKVLHWALDNIDYSRSDRETIERAIAQGQPRDVSAD